MQILLPISYLNLNEWECIVHQLYGNCIQRKKTVTEGTTIRIPEFGGGNDSSNFLAMSLILSMRFILSVVMLKMVSVNVCFGNSRIHYKVELMKMLEGGE